jgi:hypothetical protein
MSELAIRRATSIAGLLAGITVLGSVPLYFVYDGAPPVTNVLTRNLLALMTCGTLLVFFTGYSHLARSRATAGFSATLALGAGLIFLAITLVATSLEAGVVFGAPDGSLDPTIDGPLAHANMLAHGPIKRMLTAIYLLAAGFAAAESHLIAPWLRKTGYVIAAINLAFVPSLYFGTDPTKFYAVHSWANAAITGSLIIYWVIAVSVSLYVRESADNQDVN